MATFADLVDSRKAWIEQELKPWCQQAPVMQLRLAELEWLDIAGKVDAESTLWSWAWSRFPDLVNADMGKIDEAQQVTVTLKAGRSYTGYPDARASQKGNLVLLCKTEVPDRRFIEQGPFALDEIATIAK